MNRSASPFPCFLQGMLHITAQQTIPHLTECPRITMRPDGLEVLEVPAFRGGRPRPAAQPRITEVRETARGHAAARGVRAVAREIGISSGSLTKFLDGSTPYARSAAALGAWYRAGAGRSIPSPPQSPRPPILAGIGDDVLRTALLRATEEKTLREVAGQVGMTPAGLQRYIRAITRPRESTQRKLREWYLREAQSWVGLDPKLAHAAIAVLLEGLPPVAEHRASAALAILIRDAFVEADISPPRWLTENVSLPDEVPATG